ncbi:MAG: lysophospholipid acyltransferase family protein [Gemmatimonadetes bacterium]|nr:lysophospholipid acyltransferase family protein [Gemmatimonadota bacterium]
MRKPTFRDRAEYAVSRALEMVVARLPSRVARGLGTAIGTLAGSALGIRRETVEANLRRAFPGAAPEWIEEVTRQTYRHLGREAFEMVRLSRMSRQQIIELTDIPEEDFAAVQAALAEGRGLLFTTGHYGNWEVAAAAVAARGMPIDAIVKRQRNPLVDAQVEAARRRMGVEVMEMSVAPTRILRALSQGHTIGIVGDQDARSAGAFVPFFGVPSSTYRGPAMMALRFGAPLFSAVARRLPDGRYRLTAERIPVHATGDLDADVVRVTASLAASLEREIRKDPGQYFWFHKRWKTPPPTEH